MGRLHTRLHTLGLIALASALCGCEFGIDESKNTRANIAESRSRAEAIASALDEYQALHGRYPAKLADLPCIVENPTVAIGEWDSWTWGNADCGGPDGYMLQFGLDQHYGKNYPSYTRYSDGTWDIDS